MTPMLKFPRHNFLLLFCALTLLISLQDQCQAAGLTSRPTTRATTTTTRLSAKKPKPDAADAFFDDGPLPRLHIAATQLTLDPSAIELLNNASA